MRGVILGSGIIGLMAREILGSDWTIIPYSRSRFYSFRPALADNFIVRDERIDDIISHFGGKPGFIYKTMYSLDGSLLTPSDLITEAWLSKVYGDNIPSQAKICMKAKGSHFIYDLKLNAVYETLQRKYNDELQQNTKYAVSAISQNQLVCGDQTLEFDHLISTVPLSALPQNIRKSANLKSAKIWYFHVETTDLDFEGASQVLVVDNKFDFFKVSNIAANRYLFYFLQDIPIPGPYFMQFLKKFEIIDGTMINNALPMGERPDLRHLEAMNVHCVGMFAEHDPFLDVGSSLIRLLHYKSAWTS